ncbi:MAG TPA: type II secretion system protein GspJ [Burkholderiales bacterium]|nr:type II secretion system protein GspJ [Burkholderiales bacterium]
MSERIRAAGFTLVEMLVAVALMALMALICWRGLVYVANQRDTIEREGTELAQIVRVFAQLERDLAERVPNGALPASGVPRDLPLAVGVYPVEEGAVEIEIARFVPAVPGMPHAVRVLYRVKAGGLVRSTRTLDELPAAAKNEVLLLPRTASLHVRVHSGGFWVEAVRDARVQPSTPASAIEVAVEDASGARYVKVLPL